MTKRILIADDDESVRKMVGRVLESTGYTVALAGTGGEAVSKFRARPPDLVLLDLNMPDRESWKALESMRQIDPLIPIIALNAWPDHYPHAVRKGIDALLEKPLDLLFLVQTIQALLAASEEKRVTAHSTLSANSACPASAQRH